MLRILTILLLWIALGTAATADTRFDWAVQGGGSGTDEATTVTTDAEGFVYLAGRFEGVATFGRESLVAAGGTDLFLAKYTPAGEVVWAHRLGGPLDDSAAAVVVAGNAVYVGGYFEGSFSAAGRTVASAGSRDALLVRFATDGDVEWAIGAGGPGSDSVNDIAAHADGTVYMAGYFVETAIFGSETRTSAGMRDGFVAQYDAQGDVQWVETLSDPGPVAVQRLAVHTSDVFVAGVFADTLRLGTNTLLARGGAADVFLARYDRNQQFGWVQQVGGAALDLPTGLQANGTGVYLAGLFEGTMQLVDTTLTSREGIDVFLSAWQSDGTPRWVRQGSGTFNDYAARLALDANGDVFLSGHFSAELTFAHETVVSAGGSDMFVAHHTADGALFALVRGGGVAREFTVGIATAGEQVYVAGYFESNTAFGSHTLVSTGDFDTFLVQLPVTQATLGVPGPRFPTQDAAGLPLDLAVSWSPVPNADTYEVAYATDVMFSDGRIQPSEATQTMLDGLQHGQQYFWRVRAVQGTARSGWSAVFRFTTLDDGASAFWTQATPGSTFSGLLLDVVVDGTGAVFVGTTAGRIYRSFDIGTSWQEVNNGIPVGSWMKLAVGPDDALYAGNAEGDVYRSLTQGDTWVLLGQRPVTAIIEALLVDPRTNALYQANREAGVFRYDAGADQWEPLNAGLPVVGSAIPVYTLAAGAAALYAGTAGNGPYRWHPAEALWKPIRNGFPEGEDVLSLTVGPAGNLYAGTTLSGIFRSSDDGATWLAATAGLPDGLSVRSLVFEPGGTLYMATNGEGIFASSDAAQSWTEVNTGLLDRQVFALAVRANAIYAATLRDGVFVHMFDAGELPVPLLRAPADASVAVPTQTVLEWEVVPEADAYIVEVARTSAFHTPVRYTTEVPRLDVVAPQAGATYYWRVRVGGVQGLAPWSAVWQFSVVAASAEVPVLQQPADEAAALSLEPFVQWGEVQDAAGYQVQVAGDDAFATLVVDSTTSATRLLLPPLSPETTYFWRVASLDATGQPATFSVPFRFTTGMLGAPTMLDPLPGTIGVPASPVLRWAPVAGADGYDVSIATDAGFTDATTVRVAQPMYDGFELLPGTTYFWRVGAVRNDMPGPLADGSAFTTYADQLMARQTLAFGNPSETTSYRMISIPGAAALPVADAFNGAPGNQWQVYRDTGAAEDDLVVYDGSEAFRFGAGRGFWAISRGTFAVDQAVPTVPLNETRRYELALQPGWNIIGNPFDIDLDWTVVQQENNVTDPLWRFNGRFTEADAMQRYAGYYFFNRTDRRTLHLPYTVAAQARSSAKQQPAPALTLALVAADTLVADTHLLFHPESTAGLDVYDVVAPPGDFATGSLTLLMEENPQVRLAREARGDLGEGHAYTLELQPASGQVLRMTLADATADLHIRLVHETTGTRWTLTPGTDWRVPAGRYRLLVGTAAFVAAQEAATLPRHPMLLPTAPNPFREAVTITYALPEATHARLEIFTVAGRRIRILADTDHTPGRYQLHWDGRDAAGRPVASGVYLYRLTTPHTRHTHRMVRIR